MIRSLPPQEFAMPLIQITLAGPAPSPTIINSLQRETTRLMRDVLHKEAALTVVGISHLPAGAVAAGGEPVAAAAWLQCLITAGTNSAAEKAAFVVAAEKMLAPSSPVTRWRLTRLRCC
jgi:4-oxalocrotonate tautomerase